MFRAIFYLLLTVVVITVLKSIIGIVLKGVSEAMKPGSSDAGHATSIQSGPAHRRTQERSGLWNLYRGSHFNQGDGGGPDLPFLFRRNAAISTLLRWLVNFGAALSSLCGGAGFLQRHSSHPSDSVARSAIARARSRPMPFIDLRRDSSLGQGDSRASDRAQNAALVRGSGIWTFRE